MAPVKTAKDVTVQFQFQKLQDQRPFACPVCDGHGELLVDNLASGGHGTASKFVECLACEGTCIVWGPPLSNQNESTTAEEFFTELGNGEMQEPAVDEGPMEEGPVDDNPIFNMGRAEGQSDVCAELRKILDPKDINHWDKDGLLQEVINFREELLTPRPVRFSEAIGAMARHLRHDTSHARTLTRVAANALREAFADVGRKVVFKHGQQEKVVSRMLELMFPHPDVEQEVE